MRLQLILICLISLNLTTLVSAKDICVKNAKEFNEHKSEVPAVFHSLPESPAYFTIQQLAVKGGLKVRTHQKGHFVLEGHFRKGFKYSSDVADAQEICFEKGHVIVKFGNGKDPQVAKIENKGISIENFQLYESKSDVTFNKIKNSIEHTIATQHEASSANGTY